MQKGNRKKNERRKDKKIKTKETAKRRRKISQLAVRRGYKNHLAAVQSLRDVSKVTHLFHTAAPAATRAVSPTELNHNLLFVNS